MKRPLSHTKTKIMLVDYLAQKTIEFAQPNGGQVVVVTVGGQNAWEQGKIFYLLSRATKSGQIQRLFYIPYILQLELQHSLDTQIFILALRHYSSLITSTGRNLQEIILQEIFCAIGPEMAAAPPPPPPSLKWSRQDWKAFMKTEIIIGLPEPGGAGVIPRVEMMASIKKFVYQLYLPKTEM